MAHVRKRLDGALLTAELTEQLDYDQALILELLERSESQADAIANLTRALATSRRIGAAVGIVMSTEKVTEEQAFQTLSQISRNTRRKLRDIADEVVLTGAAPEA